jgi:hypothetical protein
MNVILIPHEVDSELTDRLNKNVAYGIADTIRYRK